LRFNRGPAPGPGSSFRLHQSQQPLCTGGPRRQLPCPVSPNLHGAGVWPLIYTSLLIPSGKSDNGVPAWPFVTLSYGIGMCGQGRTDHVLGVAYCRRSSSMHCAAKLSAALHAICLACSCPLSRRRVWPAALHGAVAAAAAAAQGAGGRSRPAGLAEPDAGEHWLVVDFCAAVAAAARAIVACRGWLRSNSGVWQQPSSC